jgi:hypothetical protein
MISAPAMRFSQVRLSSRKAPISEALAPSATKTARKPTKNRPLAIATLRVGGRCAPASKLAPLTVAR